MTRPLTDLQMRVLRAMAELERAKPDRTSFTPNEIGRQAGAKTIRGGRGTGGRGSGHRTFGAAQQIIFPLISLKKRGLIHDSQRDDGLSGSAFYLTSEGKETADGLS